MTGKHNDPTISDDFKDKMNPPPQPVEPADPKHEVKAKDKPKETPVENAAPNPPSTPGQPVPAAAAPANTAPVASSVPLAPVQSWAIPPLAAIVPHETNG
jgi:hypothetical protein